MSTVKNQFVCSKFIEEGPFSGCWEVMDRETGDFHYLKEIRRSSLDTQHKLSDFSNEVSFISSFRNHMLPSLVAFLNDPDSFYIIFEKPSQISLIDKIKQNGKLNEMQVQKFICSLIEIFNYMINEIKFSNWHLSLETIYINNDGSVCKLYPSPIPSSYLFNYSEILKARTISPEEVTYNNSKKSDQEENKKSRKKYFSFTSNPKCVSWFIGAASYFVSVGCFPFNGKSTEAIFNSILHSHPVFPDYLSKSLKDLLSKLLIKNPQVRLFVNKIEDHPFLSFDGLSISQKSINKTTSLWNNLSNYNNSFVDDEDDDNYSDNDNDIELRKQMRLSKSKQKSQKQLIRSVPNSHSINSLLVNRSSTTSNFNNAVSQLSPAGTSISDSSDDSVQLKKINDLHTKIDIQSISSFPSFLNMKKGMRKSNSFKKTVGKSLSCIHAQNVLENGANNGQNIEMSSKFSKSKPYFVDKVSLTPKKHVSVLHAYGVFKSPDFIPNPLPLGREDLRQKKK